MPTTSVAPPPVVPRHARIAVAVFFFVSGFGFSTWASRIPTIQHQLGLNEAQLGSVLLALPAGLMLTLPVTGWLLQRFSSRSIMLVGAVLFNLFLSLLGFAQHTWQLVVLLFCFGSSRNLLNISMNAQSVGVQALYPRSIITSFHGLWSVAGFLAAACTSLLVPTGLPSWGQFVAVGSVLTGGALYFAAHTLRVPPTPGSGRPGFALPEKGLLKYGLVAFAAMSCEGTMFDWSSLYFAKAVHTTASAATLGFAVYMMAMTAGRFAGDYVVERVGIKTVLAYSGALIGLGLLLVAAFPVPAVAVPGFVMVGCGVSCVNPLVFSLAGKSPTLSSGSAIAAVSTVGYFGFLLVPPLVGYVAEATSLRWAFLFVAAFGGVITLLTRKL